MTALTTAAAPALLASGDETLVAEVLRLAAAAGVTPEIVASPGTALPRWTRAPLVLVGADLVDQMATLRPPRRARVHVVGLGHLPDDLFRGALAVGAESVAALPSSQSWLVEQLIDAGDGSGAAGSVVGVVGGSGGAGATVLAAALARAGARGHETLLADLDPGGAGIERVLGWERLAGVRWDALMHATGRLSARSLREALPSREGLWLLGWPAERPATLPPFAAREVLSAAARGFGLTVLDLPRTPDPAADEAVARCDHVVLVCTRTVPSVTAAARTARRVRAATGSVRLVVRGSAGVSAEEASRAVGVPLLGEMADQRRLDESIDLGAGPPLGRGVLGRTAAACLRELLPATSRAA